MRAIVFVYADEAPSRSFCIRFSPCSSAQQQRRMRWKMAQNHTFFYLRLSLPLCVCAGAFLNPELLFAHICTPPWCTHRERKQQHQRESAD